MPTYRPCYATPQTPRLKSWFIGVKGDTGQRVSRRMAETGRQPAPGRPLNLADEKIKVVRVCMARRRWGAPINAFYDPTGASNLKPIFCRPSSAPLPYSVSISLASDGA